MILKIIANYKIISKLVNLEYKATHRTKIFGILWKFINPILFIGIYTFVFSTLYSSGLRGYIISMGILFFSGISTSLNSCTNWIQPKISQYLNSNKKVQIIFFSKVYFNFLPVFYLLPIMVFIQRLFYNEDFQFSIFESLKILFFTILLSVVALFYTYIISIPLSILSSKIPDLKDLIFHLLRVVLYLSPILWSVNSNFEYLNILIRLLNPFFFIFEILNSIIYRDFKFSYITLITPFLLILLVYYFYFLNKKYLNEIKKLVFFNE